MFKTLLDRDKREDLKEKVEVVFAVFTITSFVISRVQKHRAAQTAESEAEEERTTE
jgi:hypothetical protein